MMAVREDIVTELGHTHSMTLCNDSKVLERCVRSVDVDAR
jgi:hypothetical protein